MTRFTLSVELDDVAGDPGQELARILRYWAGNMKHYPLEPGVAETVTDSAYSPVGEWRLGEGTAGEAAASTS